MKCDACNLRIASTNGDENDFDYSLIRDINRGNMLYSSSDIAHVVLKSNLVVQKITDCDEFSRSHSQRALAINPVMVVLEDEVLLDSYTRYSSGHEPIIQGVPEYMTQF